MACIANRFTGCTERDPATKCTPNLVYPVVAVTLLAVGAALAYTRPWEKLGVKQLTDGRYLGPPVQPPSLPSLTAPTSGTNLLAQNHAHLIEAIDAGRNVIPQSKLADFIDPTKPITDHFTFVEELGSGAFGRVSLWKDAEGHEFAIKELFNNWWMSDPVRDFDMGLLLDHPNIVRVNNFVTKTTDTGSRHYMVMELVKGQPVFRAGIPSAHRTELLEEITDALAHMMERRVNPQDLHFGNVMITADNHWKFVDLGLYETIGEGHFSYRRTLEQMEHLLLRVAQPDGLSGVDPIYQQIQKVVAELEKLPDSLIGASPALQASHLRQGLIGLRDFIRDQRHQLWVKKTVTRSVIGVGALWMLTLTGCTGALIDRRCCRAA